MTTFDLLEYVVALELAVGTAIAVILAVRSLWTGARDASRRRAIAAARPLLLRAIVDGAEHVELSRLPRRDLIRAIAELAPSLSGRSWESVERLARRLGLVAFAEQQCRSVFWWRRLYGARVLTLVAAPDHLVDALLDDPHPLVRAQGAEWASGTQEPRLLRRLVAQLDDPERIARFTIEDALIRSGAAAVAPLRALLPSMSRTGALAGLRVASRLPDPSLLEIAVTLSGRGSARVRAAAADVLAAIGGTAAIGTLRDGLRDEATEVRAAAARGLGRLRDWESATAVAPLLADRVWEVRREAALALRAMGPPGAVLLREAQRGTDAFAADIAGQALGLTPTG